MGLAARRRKIFRGPGSKKPVRRGGPVSGRPARKPVSQRPFLRRNSIVFLDLKLESRKPKPGDLVLAMEKGSSIFHLGVLLNGRRVRVSHSTGSTRPAGFVGNLEKRPTLVLDGAHFNMFPASVRSRENSGRKQWKR